MHIDKSFENIFSKGEHTNWVLPGQICLYADKNDTVERRKPILEEGKGTIAGAMFLSRSEEMPYTEQKERWALKRSVESHPFYLE